MEPLASIKEIYDAPITEKSDVSIVYDEGSEVSEHLKAINLELKEIVDGERKKLGVIDIRPINLPSDQAEVLRKSIKTNSGWAERLTEIVGLLNEELASEDPNGLIAAIQVPWWVATPTFRNGDNYESGRLSISARLSHTYITQLMNSKRFSKKSEDNKPNDSMSVSNVLITADNMIILGWRGGHRYSNTIMTVPAGSIENDLFDTIYAEHFEETGLSRKDFSSVELIGNIYDNTIGNNTLYVFRSQTKLTLEELMGTWGSSLDSREHDYLMPFLNDPEVILNYIQRRGYDPKKS